MKRDTIRHVRSRGRRANLFLLSIYQHDYYALFPQTRSSRLLFDESTFWHGNKAKLTNSFSDQCKDQVEKPGIGRYGDW